MRLTAVPWLALHPPPPGLTQERFQSILSQLSPGLALAQENTPSSLYKPLNTLLPQAKTSDPAGLWDKLILVVDKISCDKREYPLTELRRA